MTRKTLAVPALGITYATAALVCTRLPLVNTLGYEFAVALAVVVSLATGPYVIARRKRAGFETEAADNSFDGVRLLRTNALLLLPAAAILTVNALFVPNCSPLWGAVFFLLIPVGTALFTTALACLLGVLLRPSAALAVYFALVFILLLGHPVLQVLTRPQLYAFNHLFGMFVGLSWDEAQPPFFTLFLYRITTLAYTVLMFSAASLIARRRRTAGARPSRPVLITAGIALVCIACGLVFDYELGFATSAAYTQQKLGTSIRTPHFAIYYSAGSMTPKEAREAALEHEYRLAEVARALGVEWKERIVSYIYPDRATKRRLLGTETSQVARPWVREIHLSADGWRESLKHELVHVVSGSFAPYLVKAPVLRAYGLTEGLAMAVEWDFGNRTLHQYAAAMLAQGLLPRARSVISTMGFVTNSSSLSYVASGSFCRWLIDAKGVGMMKAVYAADDPSRSGLGDSALDAEWRTFLAGVARETPDSLATAALFRGQSIFRKVCARIITERNREAASAYAEGRYGDALERYRASDALSPNAAAVYGASYSLLRLGRWRDVRALAERVLADSTRSHTVLPLHLFRGDAAWMMGDTGAAVDDYSFLVRERLAGWPTGAAAERLHAIRSLRSRDLVMRVFLRALGGAQNTDSLRAASVADLRSALASEPRSGLIVLELASRLALDSAGRPEARRLLAGGTDGSFLRQCRLLAGRLAEEAGDFTAAAEYHRGALSVSVTETERLEARDRTARCAWLESAGRSIRIAGPSPVR